MPSKKENALSKVQDLYIMQIELWNFLDDSEKNIEKRKHAEKTLRAFRSLLKQVDWRYMGGEDVLASLQWIPQEVHQQLRSTPAKRRTARKAVARRVTKTKKHRRK